jgi:hypothetical protein
MFLSVDPDLYLDQIQPYTTVFIKRYGPGGLVAVNIYTTNALGENPSPPVTPYVIFLRTEQSPDDSGETTVTLLNISGDTLKQAIINDDGVDTRDSLIVHWEGPDNNVNFY